MPYHNKLPTSSLEDTTRQIYQIRLRDKRIYQRETLIFTSRLPSLLQNNYGTMLLRWREQQEAIADWYGRQLHDTDFVFARPDGTLPDRHHVSKVFHRVIESAGLPRIRLHDLRHTFATLLRKYGRSIEEISKVLGHASEVVTVTVYSHWKGESTAVADTMDTIIEKQQKIKITEN